MHDQRTLASVAYDNKGRTTRRARFLREMDAVVPWETLHALIRPHYAVAGRGRRLQQMETMLRVYCLEDCFNLSDPRREDMLCASEAMHRFARLELGEATVCDESTILRFRHLLERHLLTEQLFAAVQA
jgi:transposase, IS5 family